MIAEKSRRMQSGERGERVRSNEKNESRWQRGEHVAKAVSLSAAAESPGNVAQNSSHNRCYDKTMHLD